jgi:hypothetical protein
MKKITLRAKGLISFLIFSLFTIISCEKDLEDVGANLIDNNNFDTNVLTSELITYNVPVPGVMTRGISQYLLGVNSTSEFGVLKASVVTQLQIPSNNYDYGTSPVIDSVILEIPYQSTVLENYSDGKPQFQLDSIFGNTENDFKLEIYELSTYLNELDFDDPTTQQEYLSSDTFNFVGLIQESIINLNVDDTVMYIKRPFLPLVEGQINVDTIKNGNSTPSLKITLDEDFFSEKLMYQVGNNLSNQNTFSNYFKGLYFGAETNETTDSFLMSLIMTNARVHLFYSHEEEFTDADGVTYTEYTGEQAIFTFSNSLTINSFDRDFSSSEVASYLNSPNQIDGEDYLFPVGASGVNSLIKLFSTEDLSSLRLNNWLINEANIYFYIDNPSTDNDYPQRLYLFKDDNQSQIIDAFTEGPNLFGGVLELDEDNVPNRYKFSVTDYVSQFLAQDSEMISENFRLKVYNPTDNDFTSVSDSLITNYNWNSKGVVLHGNLPMTEEKRAKLEVFYSELTN